MPMNNRIMVPRASGHPEAIAWRAAVIANGGSVSGATFSAISQFCRSIDAASLRDRFYRLNPFAGTGLTAALVPLYRGQSRTGAQYGNATDSNNGPFVSGDYSEAGGLTGGGSRNLDTGVAINAVTNASQHLAAYERTTPSGSFMNLMGADNTTATRNVTSLYHNNNTALIYYRGGTGGQNVNYNVARVNGFYVAVSTTTRGDLYRNGTSVSSSVSANPSNNNLSTPTIRVFAGSRDASVVDYYTGQLSMYSLGIEMSASQVSTYNTIVAALMTALGRA